MMDRRIRRTRKLLSDAIIALILKKNYEQITIQDITEEADLNRATFYLHFASKEELLAVSLQSYFDELTQRIDAETSDEPAWQSLLAIELVFEHAAENAELYNVLLAKQGLGAVINFIIEYTAVYSQKDIEKHEDQSLFTIPIEIVSWHFAGSLYANLLWWLKNDMPYSPKEMATMTKSLCLTGALPVLESDGQETVEKVS